jgi:hypothetical protein
MMTANRGALFCGSGSFDYLEAALISALALRQHEPGLPITVLSDLPSLDCIDIEDTGITMRLVGPGVAPGSKAFASRSIKTRLAMLTPYRESLYIDADMLAMQPLGDLWQVLDRAPMGLVRDRLPLVSLCDHVAEEEKLCTLNAVGGEATHFNSGLILWRSEPATECLFTHWHQQWCRFARQDQLALVRAISSSRIKVETLPSSYNISPRDARGRQVHFLHRWGGTVERGIFRRFARALLPAVVADAQKRLYPFRGRESSEGRSALLNP